MSLLDHVTNSIKSLQDPKGSNKQAIKKYLEAEHHITPRSQKDGKNLAKTLREAVENGSLNLHRGKYTVPGFEVPAGSKKTTTPRMTKQRVHDLLRKMGVKNPSKVSGCLKSGIQRGHIKVTGDPKDLDIVIAEGDISDQGAECNHGVVQATLRDLLYQPDYAGLDYENGCEEATFQCKEEDDDGEQCEGRMYVTNMCYGNPHFDCGKFHNHCNKCTRRAPFGVCGGDYRDKHCNGCGHHYFAGLSVSSGCTNPRCKMFRRKRYGERDDCNVM